MTFVLLASEPTRFTVALPFIAGAILLLVGSVVAVFVEKRAEKAFTAWGETDDVDADTLVSYDPKTLAKSVGWTTDAAQLVALVLSPILGLLLLEPSLSCGLIVVYVVAVATAIIGEWYFVTRVPMDQYHAKSRWIFSPVTIIGVLLNLIAAAVAAAIGG